jgi:hypothetical protein
MPHRSSTRCVRTLALCAWAALVPASAALADGGAELIAAAETASCTVVGRIEDRAQLDQHGFAAWLVVERVLAGDCGGAPRLRLGWEELARARPPRFDEGDRIAGALEPIPGHSLWRTRFADDLQRGPVFAPAAEGKAWVKNPNQETADQLRAWLVSTGAGDEDARRIALAQLVKVAPDALGAGAVERLAQLAGERDTLPADAANTLAAIVADEARPRGLRLQVVAAAGRGKWSGLRPAVAAATEPGSDIIAAALAALAGMDGGLPQDRVARLVQDSDPAVRAVGVTNAIAPEILDTLPALVSSDPAAPVRAAAAATLVRRRGLAAFDAVRPAFADPAPEVPVALAEAFAEVGETAVAPLENLFLNGSFAEARGAALALHGLGTPGRDCLARLAREASDERRRHLAEIAVGKLETHTH